MYVPRSCLCEQSCVSLCHIAILSGILNWKEFSESLSQRNVAKSRSTRRSIIHVFGVLNKLLRFANWMLKKRKVIKRFVITTVRTNDRSIGDRYNRFHLIILIFGCPHSGTLNIIIIIVISSQSKVLPKTRPALLFSVLANCCCSCSVRNQIQVGMEFNKPKKHTTRCHVESILFGLFGGSLYSRQFCSQ